MWWWMLLDDSQAAHADARPVFARCRDRNSISWVFLSSPPPRHFLYCTLKQRAILLPERDHHVLVLNPRGAFLLEGVLNNLCPLKQLARALDKHLSGLEKVFVESEQRQGHE